MPDNDKKKRSNTRAFIILRRILATLILGLCLFALLLFSLPTVLSSDWLRGQLETQLAKATGKPARIETLAFSWSDGLRLKGLEIGEGQLDAEGFVARLDSLHVDASLLAALRGQARLEVDLAGLRLRVPYKADQPLPPSKPLTETLRTLFDSLRAGLEAKALPLDVQATIALSDMTVRLEPGPGGTALELRRMALHLDCPSLKRSPLTLTAELELAVGTQPPGPVRLRLSLDKLVDGQGRLAPAQAEITTSLEAPGLRLSTAGSLAKTVTCDLRAALREASALVRPLIPALPDLDGALALSLTLAQPGPDKLGLGLALSLEDLRAARGSLGDKAVGPVNLRLRQEAELELKARTMRLPGSLELRPTSRVGWQGELLGVSEGAPRVTLAVSPLHLALGELLPALLALLPPGLTIGTASLDAEGLDLSALLPTPGHKPDFKADIRNLEVRAKAVTRRDPAGTLSIGDTALRLESATLAMQGEAPGRAEAVLSASLDNILLNGKTPLRVGQVNLTHLALQGEALRAEAQALFGLTGGLDLELSAQARDLEAKGHATAPSLAQSLRLRLDLPAGKWLTANLAALDLTLPMVRVLQADKKSFETPMGLHASAPNIRLSGPAPLTPTVQDLRLDLDLGQALRCAATLSLGGQTGRDVNSSGQLSLDAQKLSALAAAFAPAQTRASGGLALDWTLAATLPSPQNIPAAPQNAKAAPKKLSQTIQSLGFVHGLEAVLRLNSLGLDWPLAAKPGQASEIVRLRGLSTPRPLRLTSREGARESSLEGSLAFGPMNALPGLGPLAKPLRGLLTINAAQQGARSVQLSEVLHLEGLELDQNLSLTLDKLDTVLDRDADRLAAVLEQVDASLAFKLVTGLQALPAQGAAKGLSGKGRVELGAEARLNGGRSLALSARLLSPGLDLSLGPDLAVSGFTSSLRLSRRFALNPGLRCPGDLAEARLPLSEQVFDQFPAPGPARSGAGNEALGQLLRTDASGPTGGSFGLSRLKLKSGGLPLDIHDLYFTLDTSGPVPGLRSFRAGLLGGDVMGSALLRKNAGHYALDTDLAFSGIDPSRLLPDKAPKDLGSQAETAGRISLSLPLTQNPETLLQQLRLRADFTKIGPRTLERMLYALDPEEQNETIVQQRRMLAMGHPRFLRVAAAYGNLSLSGAVEVKGFQLDLPQLDRLNIANLPLKRQLTKPLAAMPALLRALDAASGSLICRDPADPQGVLRVVQPNTMQGVLP